MSASLTILALPVNGSMIIDTERKIPNSVVIFFSLALVILVGICIVSVKPPYSLLTFILYHYFAVFSTIGQICTYSS